MSQPIVTELPKSQVQLQFTVTPDEAQPYLEQAAVDLQTEKPLTGFRPGKAPYEDVKRVLGEMRIWEAALERLVRASYVHAILEQQIETIGSPHIAVDQLVPGQDLKFTVTASTMPKLLSLCAYDGPLVTKKMRVISQEDVEAALLDLRKMRREEAVVDRAATTEDAVVVDLEMTKDHVIVEGGTAANHRVYLNEAHYIPGFAEQLMGLKKDDVKTFTLSFPTEHYQKHLAGQPLDFKVTVKDVVELRLPELNDEFAKGLGIESAVKLRELLETNLKTEADQKATEAAEIELLEKLIDGSRFSEMPDLLLNEEVRRMYHELEHGAEEQGMKMVDYLGQLKKSADQLKLELVPQAMRRVHTAIVVKEIAKQEKVEVTDQEIEAEIDRILTNVQDQETRERVSSPEYRDYVAAQMRNRKTMEILKSKAIKQE